MLEVALVARASYMIAPQHIDGPRGVGHPAGETMPLARPCSIFARQRIRAGLSRLLTLTSEFRLARLAVELRGDQHHCHQDILVSRNPELGLALHDAFTWVDRFLQR